MGGMFEGMDVHVFEKNTGCFTCENHVLTRIYSPSIFLGGGKHLREYIINPSLF